MEQAGVKVSLANLRTFPCIRRKEREGTLQVAWRVFRHFRWYMLHLLDEADGAFHPVD